MWLFDQVLSQRTEGGHAVAIKDYGNAVYRSPLCIKTKTD